VNAHMVCGFDADR